MNCIIVDDDDASVNILKQIASHVDDLSVIQTCSNPVEAMNVLRKSDVDLMFLDVEMPEMSGIDMLRVLDKRPQVILTTSHKEYAFDAYELNVVDYLIKPVTLPRLLKALDKVKMPEEQLSAEREYIFIKKDSVLTKVPINDILWVEALGDYITLHTKVQKFVLHVTLKSIESKLPVSKFVRVHRSFIVQIDNVKTVEDTTIFVQETPIPIGALYRENFLKRLNTL